MTTPPRRRISAPSRVRELPRTNPIDRRLSKFMREPPSIRLAASVIVTAAAAIVVGSGILMRLLDHKEYATVWVAMWWAMQTVTTVGYGDVTPKNPSGRIVAAFVMLEGIALLAIFTAVITSTFVARAVDERERADAEEKADEPAQQELVEQLDARFEDVNRRLERLEALLVRLGDGGALS